MRGSFLFLRPVPLEDRLEGGGEAGGASATSRVDLAAIAELTTPRGWYLCSWLPALVQSE
jgi:hypothetical protein